MDVRLPDRIALREARLAHIEAIEITLDCADSALGLLADEAEAMRLTARIASARAEAARLYRAINVID